VLTCSQVEVLIFLQGVLYAIGGSLLYAPCMSYLSEWFVERRGLANGVIFAGTRCARIYDHFTDFLAGTAIYGLILPLLLPICFDAWGTVVTLRALSVAFVVSLVPVLPFIRGRLPETRIRGPAARASDRSWARSPLFWTLVIMYTLQGFGHFLPILWLPSKCSMNT
jgi:MFS transporter, MCT family, solute carrier family 16 (monocarboxylic acid transporters), member 10